MPRLNTQLESQGAEYLTLGQLLIRGIETYPCYINQKNYDLIATKGNKVCRIQVKSRFHTGSDSFPIGSDNVDCDFVIFVSLNRGFKVTKVNSESGESEPTFYVLPMDKVNLAQDGRERWNKVHLRRIDNSEQYLNAWHLIAEFIEQGES